MDSDVYLEWIKTVKEVLRGYCITRAMTQSAPLHSESAARCVFYHRSILDPAARNAAVIFVSRLCDV